MKNCVCHFELFSLNRNFVGEKMEAMLIDKTLLRFMIVGVVNSIVGMGTMMLLYNVAHCSYWLSSAANYVVGSIVSYFLNRYFTFHYHGSTWRSIVRFTFNIIVCYLIAYSAAKPLMAWLLRNESVTLQENVAMLTGFVLFIILNYAGQRFFAFRETPEEGSCTKLKQHFNECDNNQTDSNVMTVGSTDGSHSNSSKSLTTDGDAVSPINLSDKAADGTDAYLILAHEHPTVLAALVAGIDHPRHHIFIHIDARKPVEPFREAVRATHSPVCFISERVRVVWGTFEVVRAEWALYKAAMAQGCYSHYHLLSGTTLPLRSAEEIHRFFEEHRGKEFLAFHDTPQADIDYRQHYRYHKWAIRPDRPLRGLRVAMQVVSLRVQRMLGMAHPSPIPLRKGSQWCSLTHEAVTVLMERREETERIFRHAQCPDESYKHSLICDSPRAKYLYGEGLAEWRSLQYVRFDSVHDAHPHRFAMTERAEVAALLAGTPYLFARKFLP